MPRDRFTSRPGNAPIVRVGHTTSGKYGSDPNARVKGSRSVRDLKAK